MIYETLIKQGKIKSLDASEEEIKEILALADRDLKLAEFVISQNWDWAFSIGYNAALQASRAFMYAQGFRPSSTNSHKNTFEFMSLALGKEYVHLIGFFDRMRPKRNQALYDTAGLISETEVRELLKKSKEYVGIVKEKLKKNLS